MAKSVFNYNFKMAHFQGDFTNIRKQGNEDPILQKLSQLNDWESFFQLCAADG